jgi:hypothetical protein
MLLASMPSPTCRAGEVPLSSVEKSLCGLHQRLKRLFVGNCREINPKGGRNFGSRWAKSHDN